MSIEIDNPAGEIRVDGSPLGGGAVGNVSCRVKWAVGPTADGTVTFPAGSEEWDTADMFDDSTGGANISIPSDGVYAIHAQFRAAGGAAIQAQVRAFSDAGVQAFLHSQMRSSGGYTTWSSGSGHLYLTAGSYVYMQAHTFDATAKAHVELTITKVA